MLSGEPGAANTSTVDVSSTTPESDNKSTVFGKVSPDTAITETKIGARTETRPVQKQVAIETRAVVIAPEKSEQKTQVVSNGDDVIILRSSGESWGEVQDADNNRLFYSLMKAGDSNAIKGRAPFKVFLGNAPSVRIEINNQPVDISRYIRQNNIAHIKITAKASTQSGGSRQTTTQVIDQFVPETSGNGKVE